MSKYGLAAVRATELYTTQVAATPWSAWAHAMSESGLSRSSQDKGCPRNAYLGLCEEGLVKGIPVGRYTQSVDNKQYAIKAVCALVARPELARSPRRLWKAVVLGEKTHNSQMDVVCALWLRGLLNTSGASHST